MRFYLDGDSCFRESRAFLLELASEKVITLLIVQDDSSKLTQSEKEYLQIVRKGKDSVDTYILGLVQPGDVLITRDLIFAKKAIEHDITVLNDRGVIFSLQDIGLRIQQRDLTLALKAGGNRIVRSTKGISKRDLMEFKSSIYKILNKGA